MNFSRFRVGHRHALTVRDFHHPKTQTRAPEAAAPGPGAGIESCTPSGGGADVGAERLMGTP